MASTRTWSGGAWWTRLSAPRTRARRPTRARGAFVSLALVSLALGTMALFVGACASGGPTDDGAAPTSVVSDRPSPTGTDGGGGRGGGDGSPRPGDDDADQGDTAAPVAPGSLAVPPPAWLGTRVLALGPDGFAAALPTPTDLVDRQLITPDHLPRPNEERFMHTVAPVPADVLAASTWHDDCPVAAEDLRYVTVTFWGFDGWVHRGELLVHRDAVAAMVAGFGTLFERRFPIEEMRIIDDEDLAAPPTGDGNITSAFVCREGVESSSWSQHAYGAAVDINPFHNPYVRGDVVLPELASVYTVRHPVRPGMLTAADVAGFVDAGWRWGGEWTSRKDYMHLSAAGT